MNKEPISPAKKSTTNSSDKAKSKAKGEDVNKTTLAEIKAKIVNLPSYANSMVQESFGRSLFPDLEWVQLEKLLNNNMQAVKSGNMAIIEALLVGQAQALQTMFVSLSRRGNEQNQLEQYKTFLNLAFKAQSQSRATIQTLIELKYPKQMVLNQQNNITQGHQQVNNGGKEKITSDSKPIFNNSPASENKTVKNELLEQHHANTIESEQTPQTIKQRLERRKKTKTIREN